MSLLSVSIKSNRFFPSHVSVHADNDTSTLARPFKSAYNELRAIDGIDDFANLVGQILPKLGQSIATLGIVVPATPFVAMGAAGAIEDAQEQFRKIYPDLMLDLAQQKDAIFEQLPAQGFNANEIALIESNFDRALEFLRANGSDRLRYQIDQYERSNTHRTAALLDRNASLYGAVGMTGMTVGMFPLMGQAVAGIVEDSANQLTAHGMALAQNAGAAGAALGTLGGIVFLPSQVAMAAKGIADSRSGHSKNEALSNDAASIDSLSKEPIFSAPIVSRANEVSQELIARKRYYNKHHSISAGSLVAAGQSLMAIGSAASLTGAGAGMGVVCAAVGAPLTVLGAGQQIVYRKKEARALGTDASESAKRQDLNLLPVIGGSGISEAVRTASSRVVNGQDDVARSKLHSLIQHVIETEAKSGKTFTEFERMQAVEALAGDAKKSRFTGTTLLKGDIAKLKPMLRDYYGSGLLAGTSIEVQHRLNDAAANHFDMKRLVLTDEHGIDILKSTVRDVVKDKSMAADEKGELTLAPRQRRKEVDVRQMLDTARNSAKVNDVFVMHLTKNLISQAKTDSKYLRHDATEQLAKVAGTAMYSTASVADTSAQRVRRT